MKVIENKTTENIDMRWNKNRTEVMIDGWLLLELDKEWSVIILATVVEPIQVESLAYFWHDYIYRLNQILKPQVEGLEYAIFCLAESCDLKLEIE